MNLHLDFDNTNEHRDISNILEGFNYSPEILSLSEEQALLKHIVRLPFKEFEFHGYFGKRRTVSFGWQYEFSGAGKLRKADDVPAFLLPLRERAARFAKLIPETLQHVLVIEYGPGAGIGWHRDKPVFGEVVGVSLLASCVLRFRRRIGEVLRSVDKTEKKRGQWERVNLFAEPRSAYHLRGDVRHVWEHSILRVDALRYSVTFRTMREE